MAETSILLVEDNPGDARLIEEMLNEAQDWPHGLQWVTSLSHALKTLSESRIDVILLDLSLPDGRDCQSFERINRAAPELPVVVMSGQSEDRTRIETLLRQGAQDYLIKGQVDSRLLGRSLRYAMERKTVELELKEALRVRSDFLSIVSHELRTPLTAIKSGISMVLHGIGGQPNEEHTEYLTIVEHNVDRLTRLINNILDFQKIEAGKVQYQFEWTDLNDIIKETFLALSPLVDTDRIELRLDLTDPQPDCYCDRDAITQVMTNLVNNAIKFTEAGSITIRTSQQDNQICFEVCDTGVGIPQDELPRLFHEFEQLPSAKRYCKRGTGLGLVIAQRIVQSHMGRIEVTSQVGEGTTFSVYLPMHVDMEVLSPVS